LDWLQVSISPFTNSFFVQKCFVKLFYACSLAMQFFDKRILVQKPLVICCWNWLQMSISTTFYVQCFHTKVFCAAFFQLQFGFVIFWCKIISAKGMCKMLVKLSTGVKERQKERKFERDRGGSSEEQCVLFVYRGQFHQHFKSSFYAHRSQKHKKVTQLGCIFCPFWICICKNFS